MKSLRQRLKNSTGLFVSKELLAKINIGKDIEMEIVDSVDREIWIRPVEKKVSKKTKEVWQSAKGGWKNHSIFGNMETKEIIEWM